jgi:ABC-2 type transport system permease protein
MEGPMIRTMPVVAITLRNLVDRRRFWLMVLLAAVPVLIALVGRVFAGEVFSERIFDQLIIRTVLPLIALVFGTAALGTELDDGTIVFLLAKPLGRSRIVAAKGLVAAGLTALLIVPATLLTGLVATSSNASMADATIAYAVAAVVGGTAYTLAFLALSSFTSRALAVGLGYVLLWEGVLAGLFEGTRAFSIRQATLGLAAELGGRTASIDTLAGTTSAVVLAAIILGSLALGGWRLSRYQMKGGD